MALPPVSAAPDGRRVTVKWESTDVIRGFRTRGDLPPTAAQDTQQAPVVQTTDAC